MNEPGNRVDCVNKRTVIANLLVSATCLVGCKSTVKYRGMECVRVPLVDDKHQTIAERMYIYICPCLR